MLLDGKKMKILIFKFVLMLLTLLVFNCIYPREAVLKIY